MDDDSCFYGTAAAVSSLARRLGLPNNEWMQDWEWQVADPARFEDFLRVYQHATLSIDERRSLMAVLVSSADDGHDQPEGERMWQAIRPWLVRHRGLHRGLIRYWTRQDADDPDDPEQQLRLSLEMRAVLASNDRLDAALRLAHDAWDRGELAAALARFRLLAAQDDSALLCVGYFHDEGIGKPRSKHDAMACYRGAAAVGSGAAASNIAILHRERGDTTRMLRWFVRSAALDDGDSQLEIARCHAMGRGTPRRPARAIAHARRAARSTAITPAGRDEAKALLSTLTSAAPRQWHRMRRHR